MFRLPAARPCQGPRQTMTATKQASHACLQDKRSDAPRRFDNPPGRSFNGAMSRRLQFCIIAVVALACGSSTCLYSGAGPIDPQGAALGGAWHPALAVFADLLTMPLPTSGIADVRDSVQIFFLGAFLLLLACRYFADSPATAATMDNDRSQFSVTRIIALLGACIVTLSLISAVASDAPVLAWGWIVRFVAGAAWACLLSQCFTPAMVRAILPILLTIGATALTLGLFHRADRGYLHFTWPIGPITLTAALAACWAAMAMTLLLARVFRDGPRTAASARGTVTASIAILSAALAIFALHSTGRRAAAVGLIAAMLVVATCLLLRKYSSHNARPGAVVAGLLCVVAAVAYVTREAKNPDRIRSGPVQVRLAYLEKSWELIRERPLFGVGPDQFIVAMTNRMAPLRAECPQVYHGNIDNAAHNEWLQAAVELGLPAGLLYLAIPLVIGFIAVRRLISPPPLRGASPSGGTASSLPCNAYTLALLAGLIAICVIEFAGITLRGPVMPVWYWTLLGILVAQCRCDVTSPSPSGQAAPGTPRPRRVLIACCAAGGSALCFLLVVVDLYGATRPILCAVGTRTRAVPRLYAEKTLADEYAVAADKLSAWRMSPTSEGIEAAIDSWRRVYQLMPTYLDTPSRYAECLILAGRPEEAGRVLADALHRINPYDFDANKLYASLILNPAHRLICVQNALRSGPLDETLRALLDESLRSEAFARLRDEVLPSAREAARRDPAGAAYPDSHIELLRIAAYDAARRGDHEAAIADQQLTAECYRRLEETSHRHRRPHEAETDAWLTLARLIFEHDRIRWREAFEAVRLAERYAVMGTRHESVADARPEAGYIGGEVVPTEFPETLYPLWRLSALLHVIAGDDQFLDLRIFAGVPPTQWTQHDLHAELARLAREAHAYLSGIPAATRPPHYDRLPEMARQYESPGTTP